MAHWSGEPRLRGSVMVRSLRRLAQHMRMTAPRNTRAIKIEDDMLTLVRSLLLLLDDLLEPMTASGCPDAASRVVSCSAGPRSAIAL